MSERGRATAAALEGAVDETFGVRWTRRAATVLGCPFVTALYLALLPLLLALGLARDLWRGGGLASTRLAIFGAWYLLCECFGLAAAGLLWLATLGGRSGRERWLGWNFALQRIWARAVFGGVERLYGVRVATEGEVGPGPLLVFVRHASLVDVLLPAVLLAGRLGLRLRWVLKRELLFDPCLDVVGQRLPNAFVRRGSGEAERELASVRRVASDLGPEEGVLIFPEGTRFTPARRERALERIAESDDPKRLERARALRNVLPPRSRGPLELLELCPDFDVLMMEHVGLDGLARLEDFLDGSLMGRRIEVRFRRIPAASLPTDPAGRLEWLDAQWTELDEWVEQKRAQG